MSTEVNLLISLKAHEESLDFGKNYAKYYFSQNDENKASIEQCEKIAADCFLQNKSQMLGICSISECPVNTAKEYYGKATEETIQRAMYSTMDLCENCHLAQNCEGCYYNFLQNTCGFIRKISLNIEEGVNDFVLLANYVQTFNFDKSLYLYIISKKLPNCTEISPFIERAWNVALDLPHGHSCKIYCGCSTDCKNNSNKKSVKK